MAKKYRQGKKTIVARPAFGTTNKVWLLRRLGVIMWDNMLENVETQGTLTKYGALKYS